MPRVLSNERSIIILGPTRDENRLMRAVIAVNENLYEHEYMENDRIIMTTVRDAQDEIIRYEIEGTPLDFFQVGLRYGKAEERDRVLECVIPR